MDRREFLKAAALSGLAVSVPAGIAASKAAAQSGPFQGLFLITVHAGGGWDPTSCIDPKGKLDTGALAAKDMNHTYRNTDIITAGGIRYTPLFGDVTNNQLVTPLGTVQLQGNTPSTARGDALGFFHKHANRLYVINGIDTLSNDHDASTRHVWSGRLAEGFPAFSAVYAGSVAEDKAMAYITGGGYEVTAGAVAATRGGNVDILTNIAKPNVINQNARYHTQDTYDRITRFQQERLQTAIDNRRLPRWRNAFNTLFTVRSGNTELTRLDALLSENLPNTNVKLLDAVRGNANGLPADLQITSGQDAQFRLGLAAYRAGLAAAMNVSYGGFDTHANHDSMQLSAQRELFHGLDFLLQEIDVQGIPRDKVMIVLGSDFGRTPGYNEGGGKDHWSTTSMIFIGGGLPGGKTVGQSTDGDQSVGHRPMSMTLQGQSVAATDANGIKVTPQHVQLALRQKLGIADMPKAAQDFPLDPVTEKLPIFG